MQTELVRENGQRLRLLAGQIYEQAQNISGAWNALDWEGAGIAQLSGWAGDLTSRLCQLANELDNLGIRAIGEADEWELADAEGATGFSRMGEIITLREAGYGGQAGGGATGFSRMGEIITGVFSSAVGAVSLLSSTKKFSHFLPHAFSWLSEDVASFRVKSSALGKFDVDVRVTRGDLLGIAFETGFETVDRTPEEGFLQASTTALVSNVLDFAIVAGASTIVATALVTSAPAIATASAVISMGYEFTLLGGNLLAQFTGSQQIANLVDTIDISTYTDRLTDGIYDWCENIFSRGIALLKAL